MGQPYKLNDVVKAYILDAFTEFDCFELMF